VQSAEEGGGSAKFGLVLCIPKFFVSLMRGLNICNFLLAVSKTPHNSQPGMLSTISIILHKKNDAVGSETKLDMFCGRGFE
jgi:hypothetical protein